MVQRVRRPSAPTATVSLASPEAGTAMANEAGAGQPPAPPRTRRTASAMAQTVSPEANSQMATARF